MMTKSDYGSCLPDFLTCKDYIVMIKLCFRRKIEKRYIHRVSKLYKSSGFGRVDKDRL